VAIWATVATTASDYQRRLIEQFGGGAQVTPVACPGLATAIDAGNPMATAAAIADAAGRTPSGCGAVVMGCTEYELAADQISVAMPGATLFGSAAAVAAQALRRAVLAGTGHALNGHAAPGNGLATHTLEHVEEAAIADIDTRADSDGTGSLTVILSGRRSELPASAYQYRQGRELASLMAEFDTVAGLPA
jgi:glutamate racemase